MAIGAYLRSPAAVVWTLLGAVAVGAVATVGWLLASVVHSSVLAANPALLGGVGQLLYLLGVTLLVAVLGVVWLPFGAGVAYAVGRRVRGDSVSFRASARAVRTSGRSLARWLKTRTAVGPLAERLITEDDVAPNEVVVGCTKYVVPALVLDAPGALPRAVERANRVTPQPGHERLLVGCLGATGLVVVGVFLGRAAVPEAFGGIAPPLAGGVVLVGGVLTAALDAAWRAKTYASQDLSEGFLR